MHPTRSSDPCVSRQVRGIARSGHPAPQPIHGNRIESRVVFGSRAGIGHPLDQPWPAALPSLGPLTNPHLLHPLPRTPIPPLRHREQVRQPIVHLDRKVQRILISPVPHLVDFPPLDLRERHPRPYCHLQRPLTFHPLPTLSSNSPLARRISITARFARFTSFRILIANSNCATRSSSAPPLDPRIPPHLHLGRLHHPRHRHPHPIPPRRSG